MKKLSVFLLPLLYLLIPQAIGYGDLRLAGSKSLSDSSDVGLNVSLGVYEKIYRKTVYEGSLGYSSGVTSEYNFRDGNYFNTNHGLGYQFNDEFRMTLSVGLDYDSNRKSGDEIRQKVTLNARYRIWD